MLDAGYPLSEVTAALCDRWQPGVRLLPMSDERVRDARDRRAARRGRAAALSISRSGGSVTARPCRRTRSSRSALDDAKPAPGVLDAIAAADVVLIAPSNPVVSIGTILAVPGVRDAVVDAPRRWSGSPRSSAARRCAAWPTRAWPRSGSR